jgi:hypothetical protein
MQLHTAPVLDEAAFARALPPAKLTVLVRSSLTVGPVPRSAPCVPLSGMPAGAPTDELEQSALLEERYREHLARRALEDSYADGELSALEY